MNFFECCYGCVAPKRYPGCSGKCPEYAKARVKYDKYIAKKKEEESIDLNKRLRIISIKNRKAIQNKNQNRYLNYRK